jgi:hypothetical protein
MKMHFMRAWFLIFEMNPALTRRVTCHGVHQYGNNYPDYEILNPAM